MQDKFELFLSIAQCLNSKLQVVPLLYGSLGLSRVLNDDLSPDDVDMLIDSYFIRDGWEQLQSLMTEEGYQLVDENEHEFIKDRIMVAFADISSLPSFAGINLSAIKTTVHYDIQFMELNAKQYLAVYTASQQDGYCKEKRGKNDALKIQLIEAYLDNDSTYSKIK
jgi:hypothetical protein